MPYYTVIANSENSTLLINMEGEEAIRLIAQFLTGDPETKIIQQILVATKELKERIYLFDKLGESAYKAKLFFSQIPTNHHFFIHPYRCDDRLQIFDSLKKLANYDGIELNNPNLNRLYEILKDDYSVNIFNGNNRVNIGVYDKTKRVCRFCGKSMPEVHFKEKAHAISESLGNKNLVCREECDECNSRFNKTIENDIANLFRFNLTLKGVKGKNGIPALKNDNISFSNDTTTRNTIGRDTLIMKTNSKIPSKQKPQEIVKLISQQASFSNTNFIPQNIYKCFCKYVLSLIDAQHLPYFKGTIDWLNEPLTTHQLPPVWHYQVPMDEVPSLVIMQRKNNREDLPYCWAIISIAGEQYMFILPFCSLAKHHFINETELASFMNIIHGLMPHIALTPQQMDGTNRVKMEISINLEIPPDCVEGRDYYCVETNP